MEKVWEVKDPDGYFKRGKARRPTGEIPPGIERDPARAYTLSLLFWGVGQNYNDQRGKGLLFQVSLIAVFVSLVLLFIFGDSLLRFLRSHGVSDSQSFLLAEFLFLCLLISWLAVAGDAYHHAAKRRSRRFGGIQNRVYPFLCSLLLPGWGQFLNGQPVKGSIFSALSVFGLFSLVSIPSFLLVWPSLVPSDERFMIESIFAVTALYAPLIPFIWLLSSYDALKVSMDDLKKEPWWERIKAANNRRRSQGWVRGVFPQIRSTLLLVLFLIVLGVVLFKSFPSGFYVDFLNSLRQNAQKRGMTVLPELIARILTFLLRFRA